LVIANTPTPAVRRIQKIEVYFSRIDIKTASFFIEFNVVISAPGILFYYING
jgi:hypothetical protein